MQTENEKLIIWATQQELAHPEWTEAMTALRLHLGATNQKPQTEYSFHADLRKQIAPQVMPEYFNAAYPRQPMTGGYFIS